MKRISTRELIYCALFAALTAIGAFIHFQLCLLYTSPSPRD